MDIGHNEGNIIDVFAIYGDFGNIGGQGVLLGVFLDENMAERAKLGRGSLNYEVGYTRDGHIKKKKAIVKDSCLYLLEIDHKIIPNEIIRPSPLFALDHPYRKIVISDINKKIEFMRIYRRRTGASLKETKDFCTIVEKDGKSEIPAVPNNLTGEFDEDYAIEWKQELELGGIAKAELIESTPIYKALPFGACP